MPTERIQRRIDRLLDDAEEAADAQDWLAVQRLADEVLGLDAANEDAPALLAAAERRLGAQPATTPPPLSGTPRSVGDAATEHEPDSFAGGRYIVQRFLGEGGKKRVYLAHDELLDRDVAFALIKTEGLDEVGRERIVREAQAMGRMGVHPHIVSILDFGEANDAPYVVTELMGGGDVEGLLEDADGPLPLAQALEIAKATARGLVFAHGQGVVHRDLKPGNVWLTSDGVAKIGDFGLAVAEGRSRLTQHGMMVGTFGYMPPEQALGQEVTPQADLYSLGAMLYELVTGALPFAGDDPTAVISQHINTAPVRPSLRSEHCPPELEAIVMRLLAKAPDDRPASATDVLEVLEAVDPESRSASDSQLNPLDRLARGVFVGRESELERLRNAADEAFAGRGSVVMLVGEPGIGKTRTAQELETYARMRGAQVLWGRAHEASGAPAFWPWVQVGRAWGAANDPKAIISSLQGTGDELVRLFPELPAILGQEPPDLPETPDDTAQFRLFDAYVRFLRAASRDAPVVIVLDDIHWADKPTLLLLQHLARELTSMRLLVVGTYRDTELARTHPLSGTLAELNREGGFERLVLRGLAAPEVRAYLTATIGREPSGDLVTRIYEETEGNPFFLAEVVNLLTEEGSFEVDSVSDIALPDGVREALGRRLDRLSEDANALLTTAAVVGREFDYETLKLMSDQDDEGQLALLEGGLDERVIEELDRPGRYRFTHALMQETLLAELSTTRSVRLHGLVAAALERQHGSRSDERASELAHHYAESSTLNQEHAEKALHYGRLAGRQAERSAAWAEAARRYELCLTWVTEDGDRKDAEAQLQLALGRCTRNDGRSLEFPRHFREAFELFAREGDRAGMAETAVEACRRSALLPPGMREELTERALRSSEGIEPRLELLLRLLKPVDPWALAAGEDPEVGTAAAESPTDEDPLVRAFVANRRASALIWHGQLKEATEFAEASFQAFEEAHDYVSAAQSLNLLHLVKMAIGDMDEAEAHTSRYLSWVEERGGLSLQTVAFASAINVAVLRGELDRAFELLEEAVMAGASGPILAEWQVGLHLRYGDQQRSREFMHELEQAADEAVRLGETAPQALATIALGRLASFYRETGDTEGARRTLPRWSAAQERLDRDGFMGSWVGLAGALEAVAFAGDDALVGTTYQASLAIPGRLWTRPLDSARGALALRLQQVNAAETHFRTGLEWCERERLPVEAGRNLQGLAEVAERRGEREQAMEHLDRAGELFSRHGAKLYLDQVLAKKEILRA